MYTELDEYAGICDLCCIEILSFVHGLKLGTDRKVIARIETYLSPLNLREKHVVANVIDHCVSELEHESGSETFRVGICHILLVLINQFRALVVCEPKYSTLAKASLLRILHIDFGEARCSALLFGRLLQIDVALIDLFRSSIAEVIDSFLVCMASVRKKLSYSNDFEIAYFFRSLTECCMNDSLETCQRLVRALLVLSFPQSQLQNVALDSLISRRGLCSDNQITTRVLWNPVSAMKDVIDGMPQAFTKQLSTPYQYKPFLLAFYRIISGTMVKYAVFSMNQALPQALVRELWLWVHTCYNLLEPGLRFQVIQIFFDVFCANLQEFIWEAYWCFSQLTKILSGNKRGFNETTWSTYAVNKLVQKIAHETPLAVLYLMYDEHLDLPDFFMPILDHFKVCVQNIKYTQVSESKVASSSFFEIQQALAAVNQQATTFEQLESLNVLLATLLRTLNYSVSSFSTAKEFCVPAISRFFPNLADYLNFCKKVKEACELFNRKPTKIETFEAVQSSGLLDDLRRLNKLDYDDQTIYVYFIKNCRTIDLLGVGELLGKNADFSSQCRNIYFSFFEFSCLSVIDALEYGLSGFKLPAESQMIDRILDAFGRQYFVQQKKVEPIKISPQKDGPDELILSEEERTARMIPYEHYILEDTGVSVVNEEQLLEVASADLLYLLSFAITLVNTDLHHPEAKDKMNLAAFITSIMRIPELNGLPEEFLKSIYFRIKQKKLELTMQLLDGKPVMDGFTSPEIVRRCLLSSRNLDLSLSKNDKSFQLPDLDTLWFEPSRHSIISKLSEVIGYGSYFIVQIMSTRNVNLQFFAARCLVAYSNVLQSCGFGNDWLELLLMLVSQVDCRLNAYSLIFLTIAICQLNQYEAVDHDKDDKLLLAIQYTLNSKLALVRRALMRALYGSDRNIGDSPRKSDFEASFGWLSGFRTYLFNSNSRSGVTPLHKNDGEELVKRSAKTTKQSQLPLPRMSVLPEAWVNFFRELFEFSRSLGSSAAFLLTSESKFVDLNSNDQAAAENFTGFDECLLHFIETLQSQVCMQDFTLPFHSISRGSYKPWEEECERLLTNKYNISVSTEKQKVNWTLISYETTTIDLELALWDLRLRIDSILAIDWFQRSRGLLMKVFESLEPLCLFLIDLLNADGQSREQNQDLFFLKIKRELDRLAAEERAEAGDSNEVVLELAYDVGVLKRASRAYCVNLLLEIFTFAVANASSSHGTALLANVLIAHQAIICGLVLRCRDQFFERCVLFMENASVQSLLFELLARVLTVRSVCNEILDFVSKMIEKLCTSDHFVARLVAMLSGDKSSHMDAALALRGLTGCCLLFASLLSLPSQGENVNQGIGAHLSTISLRLMDLVAELYAHVSAQTESSAVLSDFWLVLSQFFAFNEQIVCEDLQRAAKRHFWQHVAKMLDIDVESRIDLFCELLEFVLIPQLARDYENVFEIPIYPVPYRESLVPLGGSLSERSTKPVWSSGASLILLQNYYRCLYSQIGFSYSGKVLDRICRNELGGPESLAECNRKVMQASDLKKLVLVYMPLLEQRTERLSRKWLFTKGMDETSISPESSGCYPLLAAVLPRLAAVLLHEQRQLNACGLVSSDMLNVLKGLICTIHGLLSSDVIDLEVCTVIASRLGIPGLRPAAIIAEAGDQLKRILRIDSIPNSSLLFYFLLFVRQGFDTFITELVQMLSNSDTVFLMSPVALE